MMDRAAGMLKMSRGSKQSITLDRISTELSFLLQGSGKEREHSLTILKLRLLWFYDMSSGTSSLAIRDTEKVEPAALPEGGLCHRAF